MTAQEMRKTKDYEDAVNKIKGYSKGFEFTLDYSKIPKAKGNALKIITDDCIQAGIIESISIGLTLNGKPVDETFRRI